MVQQKRAHRSASIVPCNEFPQFPASDDDRQNRRRHAELASEVLLWYQFDSASRLACELRLRLPFASVLVPRATEDGTRDPWNQGFQEHG